MSMSYVKYYNFIWDANNFCYFCGEYNFTDLPATYLKLFKKYVGLTCF